MKLKTVVFYQSVTLWDRSEHKTVHANPVLSINLIDHLITLRHTDHDAVIVVPTANMRQGVELEDDIHPMREAVTPSKPVVESGKEAQKGKKKR